MSMFKKNIDIDDLDVYFLHNKKLVDDACHLLYKTCMDVTHPWKFEPDNPSRLHVVSRNDRTMLTDLFTESANWLGVFHNDKMVACARLISQENSPTGKMESEMYLGARIIDIPRANCIEMNRVTVTRDYQGGVIHKLMILAVWEHCVLLQKDWLGCTSHLCLRRLFQQIEFKPLLARAFKYAETDPEPVDVYYGSPRELKQLCKRLRATLASSKDILTALELVANTIPTPLYWHDTEGRVLGLNEACLQGMGAQNRTSIIGKTPYDFYPEDTANMIWLHSSEVMHKQMVMSQNEPINQISTGEYFYAKSIKAPLFDRNGKVIGVVGSSIDITAEKLSDQLQIINEAQRIALEEKEKFVTIARKVAHDIASPLSALKMISEAFKTIPETPLKIFNSSLSRLSTIASDLLTTYRLAENGICIADQIEQPQLICVYNHIRMIVEEKSVQNTNLPIRIELFAGPIEQAAMAMLQPSQFQRSLSNLLTNAAEAIGKNPGTITITLAASQKKITISICDTGKGMPEQTRQAILARQRVTKGKENGNGMGMQQVWDMLDQNGGTIDIISKTEGPSSGTSIAITLKRNEIC